MERKRVEVRVTPDQEAIFQRAAQLRGQTLAAFIVSAAQEAASRAIHDHDVLTLSVRDSLAFAQAVLDSPEPNEALRKADRRYRELFGGRP